MLKIPIPTNEDNVFYVYLTFLNPMIGALGDNGFNPNPLTPKEMDVISEIMKINDKFKSVDKEFRARYIHSSDTRKSIRETLEIDTANFNNLLHRINQKVLCLNNKPVYLNGELNPLLDNINKLGIQIEFKFPHQQ